VQVSLLVLPVLLSALLPPGRSFPAIPVTIQLGFYSVNTVDVMVVSAL
jgi:hypothetical protein